MNRKIFTLTAGALMLAASLGSASAQVTAGTDITTLKKSVSGKYLYQLGVTVGTPGAVAPTTHLLTASKDGGLSLETVGAASYSNAYGQSLWCVAFGDYVASGDYHVGLDVTNKASQKSLLVAVEDSYTAATDSINVSFGSEGTWGFSANYENSIEQGKPLYSYFTEDSVVFMIQDAASYVDAKSLAVARMSASDFFTAVGTGTGWDKAKSTAFANIAQANVLFFHIQEPAHLILNANDFNTLLNTKPEGFQKLTFTVDKNNVSFENPWSDNALKAFDANKGSTTIVDATGAAVAGNPYTLPNAEPWVYFQKGKDKFLRVDTAYSASFSSHLVFNYGKNPTAEVSAGVFQPIQGQYYFRLTYNVSKDSLGIDVAEARYLQKVGPQYTPNWIDIPSTAGSPSFLKWEAYKYSSTQWWISHPDNITYPFTAGDKLHVALVDLDKALGSRLITIGAPTVNTYAQLNMGGCNASVDFESIPEGLYVIKNTAGQALGVPIYTDSLAVGSVNSPLWTTLSQQEPNYLPSYQWVVKHTRSSELSPLSIKNREFPNISFTNVQLKKEGIVFAGSAKADITKGSFTLVPAEISNNEYLGYLHIEEKDAKLNTYDLNYLHAYNKTQYLGVGDKNAAVVKEDPTQFKFIPAAAAAVNYGYKTAKVSGKWPLNIAQLKRTAYTLTQNNKVLTIDAEKRFVYANQPAANENGLTDNGVFLIRTYNTIVTEGVPTHYYALLDTNSFIGRHDVYNYAGNADYSDGVTPLHIGYVKVGIADGNVWAYAQVQRETRTSAFAIQEYTAPLYRRFDGGSYTYGEGNKKTVEPYKGEVDPDAPVWLKFHAIPEEYIFLAENSPRGKDNVFRSDLVDKTISFAGLYNNYQYGENLPNLGYEFYVDTAFVKRTSAGLAQQPYTPMPQYMLALRPEILKGDSVWYQQGSNIWYTKDEAGNWVFGEPSFGEVQHKYVSGLTRGFYLFNAQDSVNAGNKDYLGKVADNIENTTRFAFVDGIHQGDTFYVLPKSYKNLKTTEIQYDPQRYLWSLPWYYKHYLGENTHYVPRFGKRDVDGTNHYWGEGTYDKNGKELFENGKSMVFQFRLKLGVNQRRQFYIESRRPLKAAYDEFTVYPPQFNAATNNEIGPDYAVYLNNLNGAPVQSEIVQFNDANLVNAAQGFDVVNEKADPDNANKAVSNESAVAGSVKVAGEVGSVSILNAAGKKVAISNVLGQSVANTVITSDNATIALPKGIVVVAIEGEPAVKAVVK